MILGTAFGDIDYLLGGVIGCRHGPVRDSRVYRGSDHRQRGLKRGHIAIARSLIVLFFLGIALCAALVIALGIGVTGSFQGGVLSLGCALNQTFV